MTKQINIKEALDWYIWAGVVETCGDFACINEIKEESAPVKIDNKDNASICKKIESSVIKNAKDLCLNISSLEELCKELNNFNSCNLKNTAANTVVGEGNEKARCFKKSEIAVNGYNLDLCKYPKEEEEILSIKDTIINYKKHSEAAEEKINSTLAKISEILGIEL